MLNHVSRSGVSAGECAMADMGLRAQSLFFVGDVDRTFEWCLLREQTVTEDNNCPMTARAQLTGAGWSAVWKVWTLNTREHVLLDSRNGMPCPTKARVDRTYEMAKVGCVPS